MSRAFALSPVDRATRSVSTAVLTLRLTYPFVAHAVLAVAPSRATAMYLALRIIFCSEL
jgi:hypothetical protein